MSLPVVTRPAAATEIETAYRWYEKERAGLGFEFLEAVDKLVRTIAENPDVITQFYEITAQMRFGARDLILRSTG